MFLDVQIKALLKQTLKYKQNKQNAKTLYSKQISTNLKIKTTQNLYSYNFTTYF